MEVKVLELQPSIIPLSVIKDFLKIDADYSADDDVLRVICDAANGKLEKELNITIAQAKKIKCQFDGRKLELPCSPTVAITSLTDLEGNSVEYKETGLDYRTIYPVDANGGFIDFFYPINGGFPDIWSFSGQPCRLLNVEYTTGWTDDVLPSELLYGVLMQTDYDFNNQGTLDNTIIPTVWDKVKGFSRNLTIQ